MQWKNLEKEPKELKVTVSTFALTYQRSFSHIETNQVISSANQLTGFYMSGTLAINESKSKLN